MANKSKKGAVVGYSTAALTGGALGVALCVKGDKTLDLTEEQMKNLQDELESLSVEGTEIVDAKGNVVNGYEEVEGDANKWKWTYKDNDGTEKTATYHLGDSSNQMTCKELKDADGNVVGVYKAPTEGAADGKLYINGKWYNNVQIDSEGNVKSGDTELGTLKDGKLTYQVDGKDVSVTVGTEDVTYNAILNEQNQVVGYQEVSETFPKKTFLFDEEGVKTNGVLSTRENLTQARDIILESVKDLGTGDNAIGETALKEYTDIIKGVSSAKCGTVEEYTKKLQEAVEKEGTLLNKLSAGANEVASSEIFDKINNYLGSGIADPSVIGVVGLCAVGAIAVGSVAALTAKLVTNDNNKKNKVLGATSLNSSHKNINKTR